MSWNHLTEYIFILISFALYTLASAVKCAACFVTRALIMYIQIQDITNRQTEKENQQQRKQKQ